MSLTASLEAVFIVAALVAITGVYAITVCPLFPVCLEHGNTPLNGNNGSYTNTDDHMRTAVSGGAGRAASPPLEEEEYLQFTAQERAERRLKHEALMAAQRQAKEQKRMAHEARVERERAAKMESKRARATGALIAQLADLDMQEESVMSGLKLGRDRSLGDLQARLEHSKFMLEKQLQELQQVHDTGVTHVMDTYIAGVEAARERFASSRATVTEVCLGQGAMLPQSMRSSQTPFGTPPQSPDRGQGTDPRDSQLGSSHGEVTESDDVFLLEKAKSDEQKSTYTRKIGGLIVYMWIVIRVQEVLARTVSNEVLVRVIGPLSEEFFARVGFATVAECKITLGLVEFITSLYAGNSWKQRLPALCMHVLTRNLQFGPALAVHSFFNDVAFGIETAAAAAAESASAAATIHSASASPGQQAASATVSNVRNLNTLKHSRGHEGSRGKSGNATAAAARRTYAAALKLALQVSGASSPLAPASRSTSTSSSQSDGPAPSDPVSLPTRPAEVQASGPAEEVKEVATVEAPVPIPEPQPSEEPVKVPLYQTSVSWWAVFRGNERYLSPLDADLSVWRTLNFRSSVLVDVVATHRTALRGSMAGHRVGPKSIDTIRYNASKLGYDEDTLPRVVFQDLLYRAVLDGRAGGDATKVPLGSLNALAPASSRSEYSGYTMSGLATHLATSAMGCSEGSISAVALCSGVASSTSNLLRSLRASFLPRTGPFSDPRLYIPALSMAGLMATWLLLYTGYSTTKLVCESCTSARRRLSLPLRRLLGAIKRAPSWSR